MKSVVWLVALLGCLLLVCGQHMGVPQGGGLPKLGDMGPPPGPVSNGYWPPRNIPPNSNSHFCKVYENVEWTDTIYPNCAANIKCEWCHWRENCPRGRWRWPWEKSCTRTYSCNSCCQKTEEKKTVVSVNTTVCCDGYYGPLCDRPKCSSPCTDKTKTCTAPNTCGPACFPGGCQNGGTCVAGSPNSCSCDTGYSGDHCEIQARCSSTNVCQNGGTCFYNEYCRCATGYYGVFCQKGVQP